MEQKIKFNKSDNTFEIFNPKIGLWVEVGFIVRKSDENGNFLGYLYSVDTNGKINSSIEGETQEFEEAKRLCRKELNNFIKNNEYKEKNIQDINLNIGSYDSRHQHQNKPGFLIDRMKRYKLL